MTQKFWGHYRLIPLLTLASLRVILATEIYVPLMLYYKDRCFSLCFEEILSLQYKLLHRDEIAWTLFMCTYYLNRSISMNMGVHWGKDFL